MRTFNDQFCTEPFPFTGLQTEKRASGLTQPTNLEGLHPLKVLMDGPDGSGVKKDDLVLVAASDCKTPYGRRRIRLLDGTTSIFVPKSAVFALIPAPAQKPPATPMPSSGV